MAVSHAYRAVICSAVLVVLAIVGWMVEFESVVLEFFTESIIVEFAFGMFCYSVFARTADWRARAGNGVRTLMVAAGLVLVASCCFAVGAVLYQFAGPRDVVEDSISR